MHTVNAGACSDGTCTAHRWSGTRRYGSPRTGIRSGHQRTPAPLGRRWQGTLRRSPKPASPQSWRSLRTARILMELAVVRTPLQVRLEHHHQGVGCTDGTARVSKHIVHRIGRSFALHQASLGVPVYELAVETPVAVAVMLWFAHCYYVLVTPDAVSIHGQLSASRRAQPGCGGAPGWIIAHASSSASTTPCGPMSRYVVWVN